MIFAHADIPAWTYLLDGLGAFGIIVGGYVATKSVYSDKISKQAAELITLQDKKIKELQDSVGDLTKEVHKYREDNNKMQGQLQTYKELALVSPEIISKLSSTLDSILNVLSKDGLHIDTQRVDTQIVRKSKK